MKGFFFLLLMLISITCLAQQKEDLYLLYDVKDTVHFKPTIHHFVTGDTMYEYYLEFEYDKVLYQMEFVVKDYPSQNKKPEFNYLTRDSVNQLPIRDIHWLQSVFAEYNKQISAGIGCALLGTRFKVHLVVDDPEQELVKIVEPDICTSTFE